jgi:hypothetical protein
MKIVSILTALGVLAAAAIPAALPAEAGNVRGYYRKNGTYVAPHYRNGSPTRGGSEPGCSAPARMEAGAARSRRPEPGRRERSPASGCARNALGAGRVFVGTNHRVRHTTHTYSSARS